MAGVALCHTRAVAEPEVLEGGRLNRGAVVRIGNRVHRPRGPGAHTSEAVLTHLEAVGFDGAPRFLGHDEIGRQVVSFVEGTVFSKSNPPWVDDDAANARALGRMAKLVRDLHDALGDFEPPENAEVFRALPLRGTMWNHGDVQYANAVFRDDTPVAFIDFDCCAPSDRMYDSATLLFCSRCPRPDHPDNARRERAALLTAEEVLDGYGATDDERVAFPFTIAATFDDVADFMLERGADLFTDGDPDALAAAVDRSRWQADWWRTRGGRAS